MRISELIKNLKELLKTEGDIEVELPNGKLVENVRVVEVQKNDD